MIKLKHLLSEALHTPWGLADDVKDFPNGIKWVDTPSHGGFYVPTNLLSKISPFGRKFAKRWSNDEHWYEEDLAWAWVVVAFPEIFSRVDQRYGVELARQIVKDYSPGGKKYRNESINEDNDRPTEFKIGERVFHIGLGQKKGAGVISNIKSGHAIVKFDSTGEERPVKNQYLKHLETNENLVVNEASEKMPAKAVEYIRQIKNANQKQYAIEYAQWLLKGGKGGSPEPHDLSVIAAQAVRMNLSHLFLPIHEDQPETGWGHWSHDTKSDEPFKDAIA